MLTIATNWAAADGRTGGQRGGGGYRNTSTAMREGGRMRYLITLIHPALHENNQVPPRPRGQTVSQPAAVALYSQDI